MTQKLLMRTVLLMELMAASGCKSSPPVGATNGQAGLSNSPPPSTGGLGSWFAHSLAYDKAGGRDPYNTSTSLNDDFPSSRNYTPSGGER
jgi:hypothetical protein